MHLTNLGSQLHLNQLGDIFDPHKYHSESHVMRHYKQASGANTPLSEFPTYEKSLNEKNEKWNYEKELQQKEKPQSTTAAYKRKRDRRKHEEIYITSWFIQTALETTNL